MVHHHSGRVDELLYREISHREPVVQLRVVDFALLRRGRGSGAPTQGEDEAASDQAERRAVPGGLHRLLRRELQVLIDPKAVTKGHRLSFGLLEATDHEDPSVLHLHRCRPQRQLHLLLEADLTIAYRLGRAALRECDDFWAEPFLLEVEEVDLRAAWPQVVDRVLVLRLVFVNDLARLLELLCLLFFL